MQDFNYPSLNKVCDTMPLNMNSQWKGMNWDLALCSVAQRAKTTLLLKYLPHMFLYALGCSQ